MTLHTYTPQPMSLPSMTFIHLTVSEIQPGQTISRRPPAHPDTMDENNTPTALKGCGVKSDEMWSTLNQNTSFRFLSYNRFYLILKLTWSPQLLTNGSKTKIIYWHPVLFTDGISYTFVTRDLVEQKRKCETEVLKAIKFENNSPLYIFKAEILMF